MILIQFNVFLICLSLFSRSFYPFLILFILFLILIHFNLSWFFVAPFSRPFYLFLILYILFLMLFILFLILPSYT